MAEYEFDTDGKGGLDVPVSVKPIDDPEVYDDQTPFDPRDYMREISPVEDFAMLARFANGEYESVDKRSDFQTATRKVMAHLVGQDIEKPDVGLSPERIDKSIDSAIDSRLADYADPDGPGPIDFGQDVKRRVHEIIGGLRDEVTNKLLNDVLDIGNDGREWDRYTLTDMSANGTTTTAFDLAERPDFSDYKDRLGGLAESISDSNPGMTGADAEREAKNLVGSSAEVAFRQVDSVAYLVVGEMATSRLRDAFTEAQKEMAFDGAKKAAFHGMSDAYHVSREARIPFPDVETNIGKPNSIDAHLTKIAAIAVDHGRQMTDSRGFNTTNEMARSGAANVVRADIWKTKPPEFVEAVRGLYTAIHQADLRPEDRVGPHKDDKTLSRTETVVLGNSMISATLNAALEKVDNVARNLARPLGLENSASVGRHREVLLPLDVEVAAMKDGAATQAPLSKASLAPPKVSPYDGLETKASGRPATQSQGANQEQTKEGSTAKPKVSPYARLDAKPASNAPKPTATDSQKPST